MKYYFLNKITLSGVIKYHYWLLSISIKACIYYKLLEKFLNILR